MWIRLILIWIRIRESVSWNTGSDLRFFFNLIFLSFLSIIFCEYPVISCYPDPYPNPYHEVMKWIRILPNETDPKHWSYDTYHYNIVLNQISSYPSWDISWLWSKVLSTPFSICSPPECCFFTFVSLVSDSGSIWMRFSASHSSATLNLKYRNVEKYLKSKCLTLT